jgi:hypothetical protein
MRRRWWVLLMALCVTLAQAAAVRPNPAMARGKADGSIPAWTLTTVAPNGWTPDCCTYARAIGVNLVIYQGEWTGKPQRVMVLNVWPRKLPTLKAEWQADRKNYLQHDPRAKVAGFPLPSTPVPCHGVHYQGTDHVDDFVVFCDPGKASGNRYSWSMTLDANDPQRAVLVRQFAQVVAHSRYTTHGKGSVSIKPAASH